MDELLKIVLVKNLIKKVPKRLRYRLNRFLYNYNSNKNIGVQLALNYHKNLKFFLNTKEFIGWNIFFQGSYETETNKILEEYIKPDYYVIEAGANNGSETIIIGNILRKGTGKIYAFEPAPLPYKYLTINIILNDLSGVIIPFDILLGEKESFEDFYLMTEFEANQGLSSKYSFNGYKKIITKRQTTLDEFIKQEKIERLDFLKMDIQGSEIDLIEGGFNTLNKYRPIIFTEASNSELSRRGSSIADLYDKFLSFNYEVFIISKNSLIPISNLDQIKEGNWLVKPK